MLCCRNVGVFCIRLRWSLPNMPAKNANIPLGLFGSLCDSLSEAYLDKIYRSRCQKQGGICTHIPQFVEVLYNLLLPTYIDTHAFEHSLSSDVCIVQCPILVSVVFVRVLIRKYTPAIFSSFTTKP